VLRHPRAKTGWAVQDNHCALRVRLKRVVHLFAQVWAQIASSPWVSHMLAATKASSLMWRGICNPI
jgi:hypothetical protein